VPLLFIHIHIVAVLHIQLVSVATVSVTYLMIRGGWIKTWLLSALIEELNAPLPLLHLTLAVLCKNRCG
jgi:hypothetical protein